MAHSCSNRMSILPSLPSYSIALLAVVMVWGCGSDTDVQVPGDSTAVQGTIHSPGDSGTTVPGATIDTVTQGAGTSAPGAAAPAPPSIRVTTPSPNESFPDKVFKLSGTAKLMVTDVSYRLLDSSGRVIGGGMIVAPRAQGDWGPFEGVVRTRPAYSGKMTLEVYQTAPQSTLEVDKVRIPIVVGR